MLKTINVTQDNILLGKKNNNHSCPVALALQDNRIRCSVGRYYAVLLEPGTIGHVYPIVIISLPSKVTEFIKKFDKDEGAIPFSFEVDIPDAAL